MKVPAGFQVGAATHTGCVRVNNEDDFLLGALLPPGPELLLAAIADGMGGAAGGGEASRAALRALGRAVLDAASPMPLPERLAAGFAGAAVRVHEHAAAVPALRDMGTTLTAVCIAGAEAFVGHIGDTRLYRLRAGRSELSTVDHAVREPDNLLTRCIGGGQLRGEPDQRRLALEPGDRLLLCSDGIWSVLAAPQLDRLAAHGDPQAAAEALVAAALAAGGPDNATAVVVEWRPAAAGAPPRDLALPREERHDQGGGWPAPVSLRAPWWPWLLLGLAATLVVFVVLRLACDFDAWLWLRSHW